MTVPDAERGAADRSARGWMVGTAILAILAGLLAIPRRAGGQTVFTNEQREGLEIASDSIRHADLGFALPAPGPTFLRDKKIEQMMAEQFGGKLPNDLIYWALRDTTGGRMIMIQVTGLPGLNEDKFREVLKGIEKGASSAKLVSEDFAWDDTRRDVSVTIQHPSGAYVVMRCVPSVKPRPEFVVCLQVFSAKPDDLAAARKGLTLTSGKR